MRRSKKSAKLKRRSVTGASRAFSQDFELASKKAAINIKKSPKLKIRRGLSSLTSILIFCGLIYGTYLIICWRVENDIVSDEVQAIDDIVSTGKQDKDESISETILKIKTLQEAEEKAKKEAEEAAKNAKAGPAAPVQPSLYWKYIGTDIDTVDFENLRITNPQTTAWLIVKGTNINYPVVQATDNSFYLNHSFTGALNSSGWVFMDYEDNPEFGSRNTVIYAHGRNEGTMFGTLKYALNAWWQNNTDNRIVVTATPTQLMFWETFSVYRIQNTSDYINVKFDNDASFNEFINRVTDRSAFNFGIRPTAADRVLTLSTCIGTDERMVLHARLREIVKK